MNRVSATVDLFVDPFLHFNRKNWVTGIFTCFVLQILTKYLPHPILSASRPEGVTMFTMGY